MSGGIFITAFLLCLALYVWRIGANLTLTSVAFGAIITIHGPFYWIYSRYWLHKDTWIYNLYATTAATARSQRTSQYDHLNRLSTDKHLDVALYNLDIALSLLFIGITIGVLTCDMITKSKSSQINSKIRNWSQSAINFQRTPPQSSTILFFIIIISCALLMYEYNRLGKIEYTLQYIFSQGSEIEKIQLRRAHGGFPYFTSLILSAPAVLFSIYLVSSIRKQTIWTSLASVIFVFLVLFGKMAYLSKAPALIYALQILLAIVISRTLKPSVLTATLLLLAAASGIIGMIFVANSNMPDLRGAVVFLFYRVFMIPNESLLEYFLVFPGYLPHTEGLDNRYIAALQGAEKLPPSFFRVAETIRGVGGSSTNGLFIADAWAQFKWWGLITFPIAFGALLRYLDVTVLRCLGKRPISIAVIVTGYSGVFTALSTSLFTAFLTGGLALILLIVWICSKVAQSSIKANNADESFPE